MILNVYADPVQGITLTVIGERSAHAIPTNYAEYMNELIAYTTAYGGEIKQINISGHEAYATKIANEIMQEYPNAPIEYAWDKKE